MKKIFSTFVSLNILCFIVFSSCSEDSPVQNNPGTGSTVNVNGKLINTTGAPITGATVSIAGTTVTSDAGGNFTINGVTTPYNVDIVSGIYGVQHRALTNANPQLLTLGPVVTENTATINVTVPAMSANQACKIIYTNELNMQRSISISAPSTTGTFSIYWEGNSNLTGKLIVLVYTANAGVVSTYDKYGEKLNFTLNNGSTTSTTFSTTELNVDPGEETVAGSVVAPSGLTNTSSFVIMQYMNGSPNTGGVTIGNIFSNSFSFKIPTGLTTIPKFKVMGASLGTLGGSQKSMIVAPGSTGINVNMELNPLLSSPPDNATLIDTNTIFNYSTGTGSGVYVITFSTTGRAFRVFSTETNVKIPNLSSFGLNLGSSLQYSWSVVKYSNFSNIDQMASMPLNNNESYNSYAFSSPRTFVSKP